MVEKLRKLWLCRNTLIEMVNERGYSTDQQVLSLEAFRAQFSNCEKDISQVKFVCKNNDDLVGIHFIDDEKIGKQSIEKVIDQYRSINIHHIIIVINQKMSSASMNIVNVSDIKIEIFKDEELLFNITKHVTVPKHRILSKEEGERVLKNLKITTEQMPKILKRDPVIRFLGGDSGNIIEITRKSRTAGVSIYYKIVEDKIVKI